MGDWVDVPGRCKIDLLVNCDGDMPVIYLYQPNPMRVTVPLSPFPEWQFSDVYPAVNAAKERNAQRLEWVVLRSTI